MDGHPAEAGPPGLVLEAEVISQGQEAGLLERFETLRWDPIVIRGQAARRTARHFGLRYDYGSREARPGEPMPEWLDAVRQAVARLARTSADELVEALVQKYPPGSTIGWHRDSSAFGIVIGISLLGIARAWELVGGPSITFSGEVVTALRGKNEDGQ